MSLLTKYARNFLPSILQMGRGMKAPEHLWAPFRYHDSRPPVANSSTTQLRQWKFSSGRRHWLLSTKPELLCIFAAMQETSSTTGTCARLLIPTPEKISNPYDVFPKFGSMGKRAGRFSWRRPVDPYIQVRRHVRWGLPTKWWGREVFLTSNCTMYQLQEDTQTNLRNFVTCGGKQLKSRDCVEESRRL
jgi:hypothetical protein